MASKPRTTLPAARLAAMEPAQPLLSGSSPRPGASLDLARLRAALESPRALSPDAQRGVSAFLERVRRLQQPVGRHSGFEREYAELCASIDRAPGFKAALTPQTKETRAKNRYCDVLPLDKTRVRLQAGSGGSDYINANHVDGNYIACCAPVPAAIADFWHMVWQTHVHVVLMLTNFVERERCKAHVYWDMRGQPVDFAGVHVQLVEDCDQQHADGGFLTRMFRVWTVDDCGRERESRLVKHLQLTIWPDHGVLRDFRVIAPLLHSVNAFKDEASRSSGVDTRVIVHCSAGIGRSGTFIAIDILLKQLQRAINGDEPWTEALDVARVVHRIRSQRPGMVQTPEQYEMIYQYLATILCSPDAW